MEWSKQPAHAIVPLSCQCFIPFPLLLEISIVSSSKALALKGLLHQDATVLFKLILRIFLLDYYTALPGRPATSK